MGEATETLKQVKRYLGHLKSAGERGDVDAVRIYYDACMDWLNVLEKLLKEGQDD